MLNVMFFNYIKTIRQCCIIGEDEYTRNEMSCLDLSKMVRVIFVLIITYLYFAQMNIEEIKYIVVVDNIFWKRKFF